MGKPFTISIIGSGNVGTNLALELERVGHHIEYVWSNAAENAEALTGKLTNCTVKSDLDFRSSNADFFIIAVKDIHIPSILQSVTVPETKVILHTSGSFSLEDSKKNTDHKNIGILYPLQTFLKAQTLNMTDVPLLLEFSNKVAQEFTQTLATSLSNQVRHINSFDRARIHMAAVFTCNFVNHLFYISESILKTQNLEPTLLQPLVQKTIENIFDKGSEHSLTGPASRKDLETIEKHLTALSSNKEHKELYEVFTQQIAKRTGWNHKINNENHPLD